MYGENKSATPVRVCQESLLSYHLKLFISYPNVLEKVSGLFCLGVRMAAKLLIIGKVCLIQCMWHNIFQIKIYHFSDTDGQRPLMKVYSGSNP